MIISFLPYEHFRHSFDYTGSYKPQMKAQCTTWTQNKNSIYSLINWQTLVGQFHPTVRKSQSLVYLRSIFIFSTEKSRQCFKSTDNLNGRRGRECFREADHAHVVGVLLQGGGIFITAMQTGQTVLFVFNTSTGMATRMGLATGYLSILLLKVNYNTAQKTYKQEANSLVIISSMLMS